MQATPETDETATQAGTGAVSRGALAEEVDEGGLAATGVPARSAHIWPVGRAAPPPPGCWNCSAQSHRANACPLPPTHTYCYRCGRDDVTIRECPNCAEAWRAQGPYTPGHGHPGGNQPRRDRGAEGRAISYAAGCQAKAARK